MPRVSDTYQENRKQEIVQAAWRCFAENGFHQTSMRDICAAADMSAGAVYGYFDSKEAIIAAVAKEGRRAGTSRITHADEADDALQAIVDSIDRYMACLRPDTSIPSARVDIQILTEALRDDFVRSVVLQNVEEILRMLESLVEKGQNQGRITRDIAPRAFARLVLALIQGIEYQRALHEDIQIDACRSAIRSLLTGKLAPESPE